MAVCCVSILTGFLIAGHNYCCTAIFSFSEIARQTSSVLRMPLWENSSSVIVDAVRPHVWNVIGRIKRGVPTSVLVKVPATRSRVRFGAEPWERYFAPGVATLKPEQCAVNIFKFCLIGFGSILFKLL